MFVGSEACAAKVKVNVTTPWTGAWQANGGYFGMFAEVSTGSSCATIVTETAANNQSRILRRVVIGSLTLNDCNSPVVRVAGRSGENKQVHAARVPAPHELHLVPGFAQHYRHFQLFLAPEDGYFHRVAGAMFVHDLGEDLLALDFFSVDGDD